MAKCKFFGELNETKQEVGLYRKKPKEKEQKNKFENKVKRKKDGRLKEKNDSKKDEVVEELKKAPDEKDKESENEDQVENKSDIKDTEIEIDSRSFVGDMWYYFDIEWTNSASLVKIEVLDPS